MIIKGNIGVVTLEAIKFFGDIVDVAYIHKLESETDEEFETYVKTVFHKSVFIKPDDCRPVFVKFKNGCQFEIFSSEWGGLRRVNELEFLQN